jgi:hypothetical protein
MSTLSSRDLATQFIENPTLTKSKRFYVYNIFGARKCRVKDLRNINGEQKLVLVYYFTGNKKKISNPKISISNIPMFEEIDFVDDEDDEEIDDKDENVKEFGGNKKSKKVKKNKKITNKKRTNKKRTNKKGKK